MDWAELQPTLVVGGSIILILVISGIIVELDTRLGLPDDDKEDFDINETAVDYQQRTRKLWVHALVSLPAYFLKRVGQFACYGLAYLAATNDEDIAFFGYLICALILRHTFVMGRTQAALAFFLHASERRRAHRRRKDSPEY